MQHSFTTRFQLIEFSALLDHIGSVKCSYRSSPFRQCTRMFHSSPAAFSLLGTTQLFWVFSGVSPPPSSSCICLQFLLATCCPFSWWLKGHLSRYCLFFFCSYLRCLVLWVVIPGAPACFLFISTACCFGFGILLGNPILSTLKYSILSHLRS